MARKRDAAGNVVGEVEQLLMQKDYEGAENAIRRAAEAYYRSGYKDAVTNYAIWRDGEQFVGVLSRPLPRVLAEVDQMPVPIQY